MFTYLLTQIHSQTFQLVPKAQYNALLGKLHVQTEARIHLENDLAQITKKYHDFEDMQKKINVVMQHRYVSRLESQLYISFIEIATYCIIMFCFSHCFSCLMVFFPTTPTAIKPN